MKGFSNIRILKKPDKEMIWIPEESINTNPVKRCTNYNVKNSRIL